MDSYLCRYAARRRGPQLSARSAKRLRAHSTACWHCVAQALKDVSLPQPPKMAGPKWPQMAPNGRPKMAQPPLNRPSAPSVPALLPSDVCRPRLPQTKAMLLDTTVETERADDEMT